MLTYLYSVWLFQNYYNTLWIYEFWFVMNHDLKVKILMQELNLLRMILE